jgi:hypothetical protein
MAILKLNGSRTHLIFGLALGLVLMFSGLTACQQAEEAAVEEEAVQEEGKLSFEGTAKLAVGKYLFIPEAQGFDIVIQGSLPGGDLSSLVGQEVKVEGELTPDLPTVLVADTLETKEATGEYQTLFTRTEEPVLDDYLSLAARDDFEALTELAYNQNDGWEGKEKVKVYGMLETLEDKTRIMVLDEEGRQVGFVLVDSMSEIADFYMKKLPLFNSFWFYLEMKESVPWRTRRNTRELFSADVVFAGLF